MNLPVSVIIPAYNVDDFIIECLASISMQTYFKNNKYEILVGIDGCEESLNILIYIQGMFDNLRIINIPDHNGIGVTLNALMDAARYDIILKVDADDVCKHSLVEKAIGFLSDYNVVKFRYDNFSQIVERVINESYFPSESCYMFNRKAIVAIGGFIDWMALSEQELLRRVDGGMQHDIDEVLFHRRIHEGMYGLNKDYGIGSLYRGNKWKRLWGQPTMSSSIPYMGAKYKEIDVDINAIRHPLSIVIAAHGASAYIEECLDSIYNNTYINNNDEFEVLVGVDGCESTESKMRKIMGKYKNLRLLVNDKNVGVYTTINTLMEQCRYDIILRFDADDVMKPTMISRGMFFAIKYDVVMFGYDTFCTIISDVWPSQFKHAHGVVFMKKELFERAGGFRAWSCAADSEFLSRTRNHSNRYKMMSRLFYRRIHDNSLTRKTATAYYSDGRKAYKEQIRVYRKDEDIKIDRETVKYKEV